MRREENDGTYVHSIPLPIGARTVSYPADVEIISVKLRGVRNRPLVLHRIRWEEWERYSTMVRGVPTMYSLNFKQRLIGVWPASLQGYELLVQLRAKDDVVASADAVGGDGG